MSRLRRQPPRPIKILWAEQPNDERVAKGLALLREIGRRVLAKRAKN